VILKNCYFIRAIFAFSLLGIGLYFLYTSSIAWADSDYKILAYGERGKSAISGVIFSIIFILYGVWKGRNLVGKRKT